MAPRRDRRNDRQTVDDGKSTSVGTEQSADGCDRFWCRRFSLHVGRKPHENMLVPSGAAMKYLVVRVITMLSCYDRRPSGRGVPGI